MNESTQINGLLYNSNFNLTDILRFSCTIRLENSFTQKWESEYYDIKVEQPWGQQPKLHKIPLSLETYFAQYNNPLEWKVMFQLKSKYNDPAKYEEK